MLWLVLSACVQFGVGFEPGLANQRPTYVDATAEFGLYNDDVVASAVVQLRGGVAGAEGSVGLIACKPVGDFVIVDFCGRAWALELGWRRDHVTFGGLSPAAGLGVSVPLDDFGAAPGKNMSRQTMSLTLGASLWAGLDVRTPTSDIGPYASLQIKVGVRFRHYDRSRRALIDQAPADPPADP